MLTGWKKEGGTYVKTMPSKLDGNEIEIRFVVTSMPNWRGAKWALEAFYGDKTVIAIDDSPANTLTEAKGNAVAAAKDGLRTYNGRISLC